MSRNRICTVPGACHRPPLFASRSPRCRRCRGCSSKPSPGPRQEFYYYWHQYFESGSVFTWVSKSEYGLGIWIRIQNQAGQNCPLKRKKGINFMFEKEPPPYLQKTVFDPKKVSNCYKVCYKNLGPVPEQIRTGIQQHPGSGDSAISCIRRFSNILHPEIQQYPASGDSAISYIRRFSNILQPEIQQYPASVDSAISYIRRFSNILHPEIQQYPTSGDSAISCIRRFSNILHPEIQQKHGSRTGFSGPGSETLTGTTYKGTVLAHCNGILLIFLIFMSRNF